MQEFEFCAANLVAQWAAVSCGHCHVSVTRGCVPALPACRRRAQARAALYGRVAPPPNTSATVVVTLSPPIDGHAAFEVSVAKDGTWKALLAPAAAGGLYSASAACAACENTSATTIVNLTFGDVWVCSGQSTWAAR